MTKYDKVVQSSKRYNDEMGNTIEGKLPHHISEVRSHFGSRPITLWPGPSGPGPWGGPGQVRTRLLKLVRSITHCLSPAP